MTPTVSSQRPHRSNYRLLGLVGQGQFGQVYCAIHRKTGRLVALKNLKRDRLPTHRFLRELRFLLSLEHPYIANCHALEQTATGRQLVLDYCEGGTLRDLLEQESQLTLAEILSLMTQVLTALEHAHSQGIVHCDIKPENILLSLTDDGWQAKVSDFGIARLSQELRGDDRTGATGSPAYMAPERFYHQYAESSDLYAVGIVLYELLIGDRPFGGSHAQLMVAHLNHAVNVPATLPQGLKTFLYKSLEKLMARRYRDATEMKAALISIRQTFTAAELRERFPRPIAALTPVTFQPQPSVLTVERCQDLKVGRLSAASEPTLLAAVGTTVYGWSLADIGTPSQAEPDHRWFWESPVKQVIPGLSRAIAVTETALYHLAAESPPHPMATFPEPIRVVHGQRRWVMVQSIPAPENFWLVDSLGRLPLNPRPFTVSPSQASPQSLLLDNRHFLFASVADEKTRFRIMTRWGKPLGNLSLKANVRQLFPSQKTHQFLAQAGTVGQDLLVIRLQPFRVMRCRLGISADWVGELIVGFVAISAAGQLRIVNFQGQMIGQVDHLPRPKAIAFYPPYHFWLATQSAGATELHCIDIRKLDLEIVF